MPAYSTWQPTEGKIEPVTRADQSATRRLVDPRGDLIRGKPIASTLLGVFGGPSDPTLEGSKTAYGESCPAPARSSPPNRSLEFAGRQPDQSNPWRFGSIGHHQPCGAIVGLFTRLRNRPDRPFRTNDSTRFLEKLPPDGKKNLLRTTFSPINHECVRGRITESCVHAFASIVFFALSWFPGFSD